MSLVESSLFLEAFVITVIISLTYHCFINKFTFLRGLDDEYFQRNSSPRWLLDADPNAIVSCPLSNFIPRFSAFQVAPSKHMHLSYCICRMCWQIIAEKLMFFRFRNQILQYYFKLNGNYSSTVNSNHNNFASKKLLRNWQCMRLWSCRLWENPEWISLMSREM